MPLTEAERKKMEAESDERIARRKRKEKLKSSEAFQVPKWMLEDNHPETKPGSRSPKVGQNVKHPTNKPLKPSAAKRKSRIDKYLNDL
jgi:hypothetical protein